LVDSFECVKMDGPTNPKKQILIYVSWIGRLVFLNEHASATGSVSVTTWWDGRRLFSVVG